MASYIGIKGNKKADRKAKHTANGQISDTKELPKYVRKKIKHSVSALWQANNKERNETWKKEWHVLKTYRGFKARGIISPDAQKFLTLTSNRKISRKITSLIFQLRVGHTLLNSYLHRYHKVDSDKCPTCGDKAKQLSISYYVAPSMLTSISHLCYGSIE
jgi:hypothetical protein